MDGKVTQAGDLSIGKFLALLLLAVILGSLAVDWANDWARRDRWKRMQQGKAPLFGFGRGMAGNQPTAQVGVVPSGTSVAQVVAGTAPAQSTTAISGNVIPAILPATGYQTAG